MKANEEDEGESSPISSDLTRETIIDSLNSNGFLESIENRFEFNTSPARDREMAEMFLSKIKGSFEEISGKQCACARSRPTIPVSYTVKMHSKTMWKGDQAIEQAQKSFMGNKKYMDLLSTEEYIHEPTFTSTSKPSATLTRNLLSEFWWEMDSEIVSIREGVRTLTKRVNGVSLTGMLSWIFK
ncbi:Chaperone protein ClpB1 [Sesbania bispinosa]|nr:Chaperone protein ClpB1 [Sesbania bispinosa]